MDEGTLPIAQRMKGRVRGGWRGGDKLTSGQPGAGDGPACFALVRAVLDSDPDVWVFDGLQVIRIIHN
jgi:hypothetical protein